MNVKKYRISLGFKAKYMPYYGPGGSVGPFHHGIDYATPVGVSVTIGDKTIGKTGATGLVTGPHIHIDRHTTGSRDFSGYRDPSDWDTISGRVIFAGYAGSAGNMIKIQSDNGHIYRFLHLSKISVKIGDKVTQMYKGKTAKQHYDEKVKWAAKADKYHTMALSYDKRIKDYQKNYAHKDTVEEAKSILESQIRFLDDRLAELETELKTCKDTLEIEKGNTAELRKAYEELKAKQTDTSRDSALKVVVDWLKSIFKRR